MNNVRSCLKGMSFKIMEISSQNLKASKMLTLFNWGAKGVQHFNFCNFFQSQKFIRNLKKRFRVTSSSTPTVVRNNTCAWKNNVLFHEFRFLRSNERIKKGSGTGTLCSGTRSSSENVHRYYWAVFWNLLVSWIRIQGE